MNRIGNKWSEDEEQRMVKGFQAGKNIEDMAKDHQRTPKAMEMRRDALLRKLSSKASTPELASMFGMHATEVRDILAALPVEPSSATPKTLEAILQRLDRIETLVEKTYRRLKNPK